MLRLLTFAVTILMLSCTPTSSSSPKKSDKKMIKIPQYEPKIALPWHEVFKNLIAKEENPVQAWALFSVGGWADDGQRFIIQTPAGYKVYVGKPGLRAANADQLAMKVASRFDFRPEAFTTLSTVEESIFDSLNYEYLHLDFQKKAGSAKQVYLRVGNFDKYPAHSKLIQSFKSAVK